MLKKIIFAEKRQSRPKESVKIDLRPAYRERLPNISYLVTEKHSFPLTPEVQSRVKAKTLVEFKIWLKLFLSKHPHLEFLKIHQSSLSGNVKQWLFRNTKTNIIEARTQDEIKESIRPRKGFGGHKDIRSFDENATI